MMNVMARAAAGHFRRGQPAISPAAEGNVIRPGRRPAAAEFDRVSVDAPWIELDTTSGYRPGLADIVAFVTARD